MRMCLCLLLLTLAAGLCADPFTARTFPDADGRLIEIRNVPGIPVGMRDPGPIAQPGRSAVIIPGVPAFDWSYGCSATSGAMIAGYYDRGIYSHIYTGPTNGGAMPLNNSAWGNGECPLSATHQGYDGLLTPGHVERFWTDSSGSDPFGTGDPTGTYNGCTADYMGTNQDWWGNGDGSTNFFYYTDGSPLYDAADFTAYTPHARDGMHGLRLFFESRGYAVTTNYNQFILGYEGNSYGYDLAQFQASIDAGKPVLIQIQGHTMVGIGYESTDSTIYVLNTWDYSVHSMTWGGTYSGMQHFGVCVIELGPTPGLALDSMELAVSLQQGQTGMDGFTISNLGNGVLTYTLDHTPGRISGQGQSDAEGRNITGSTLSLNTAQYQPSATLDWVFTVHNASPDDEWLREVYIRFPAGIGVNSFTNFTGGGNGDMLPQAYMDGGETVVHWFSDLSNWGVVYPGNDAVAVVNVSIGEAFTGPITLPWQIKGDVYGAAPHELTGSIALEQLPWQVEWFHAMPVCGFVDPGMNRAVTGYFDAAGMAPGTYHARLTLHSDDAWQPVVEIPVTMEVLGAAAPVITGFSSGPSGSNLAWNAVPSATSYKVYRSSDPNTGFGFLGETTATSYYDPAPLPKAFYRVTAVR